jgi:hypothetical protein
MGILIVFVLSRYYLRLSTIFSVFGAMLMFLSQFKMFVHTSPVFAFDAFSSVLVGLSVLSLLSRHYGIAMMLAMWALFTKETVLYAPIASSISYLIMCYYKGQKLRKSDLCLSALLMLIPLLTWICARLIFFKGFHNVYAIDHFASAKAVFLTAIKGFVIWPIGNGDDQVLRKLVTMSFGQIHILSILELFTNILCWILIFYSLHYITSPKRNNIHSLNTIFLIVPYILLSFLIVSILGLSLRHGYSLYLFMIPVLTYAASHLNNRIYKNMVFAVLVFLLITSIVAFTKTTLSATVHFDKSNYIACRNQIRAINAVNQKTKKLFIINDIVGETSGSWLAEFARRDIDIVVLTSGVKLNEQNFSIKQDENYYYFTLNLIDTAKKGVILRGATPSLIISKATIVGETMRIERNNELEYMFYGIRLNKIIRTGKKIIEDFGENLTIKVRRADDQAFLYFDFDLNKWEIIQDNL